MENSLIGIIGSGSWATAIAKIITDNGHPITWWVREQSNIDYFTKRHHNPHYLRNTYFNVTNIHFTANVQALVDESAIILIAVPSIHIVSALEGMDPASLKNKKVISAVKGVIPKYNILLNEYLAKQFNVSLENYFTLLGPSHAEEVAAEQLSYLTFSGLDTKQTEEIASYFATEYINTRINNDVLGVQYAAVAKNIYALGAGIAHGLEYGDNFLSVFIANAAKEMDSLLSAIMQTNNLQLEKTNYTASVYLGDLLVTCYSLHSRNRTFGNMIGKGYSVRAAELELNMVAEGYNASKCIMAMKDTIQIDLPIIKAVYQILWEGHDPLATFKEIEKTLV
jgi:glycerol-3-phosphate dehydrogenase (NAD(P)+)